MIGFWADFFTVLQVLIGLFLIFIIMLQRGKGGGLVGALGGMGGASAFGPKADIQVLKLTIGLAVGWVVVACVGIFFNRWYSPSPLGVIGRPTVKAATDAETKTDTTAPAADGTKADTTKKADEATDGPKLEATPKAETKAKTAEPAESTPETKPAAKAAAPEKADAPAEQPAADKK